MESARAEYVPRGSHGGCSLPLTLPTEIRKKARNKLCGQTIQQSRTPDAQWRLSHVVRANTGAVEKPADGRRPPRRNPEKAWLFHDIAYSLLYSQHEAKQPSKPVACLRATPDFNVFKLCCQTEHRAPCALSRARAWACDPAGRGGCGLLTRSRACGCSRRVEFENRERRHVRRPAGPRAD